MTPTEFVFDSPALLAQLERSDIDIDSAPFGVIAMDRAGIVTAYNRSESKLSGLDPDSVVGCNFFEQVGPCTNNYLVAQRFADSDELDEIIDYVFTFKMAPTPVRLRMLAGADSERQFLLVQRR